MQKFVKMQFCFVSRRDQKIKKGKRLNTLTCAIHFSLMASMATASPQCKVRISNGALGKPPAAGKNNNAVPLVGRLGFVVIVVVWFIREEN